MSRIAQKTLAIVATAAFVTASPLVMAQAQEVSNTNQASTPASTPAPTPAPTPANQQVRGIDVNAPASLTIEKREGEVGPDAKAIAGFKFKVEPIKLDNKLDTVDGWNEVSRIVDGTNDPDLDLDGVSKEITTGTNGEGKATLPVGLYRVTEVQNGDFTVSAPFFVTLPLNNDDGSLDYNPTISPKTQNVKPKITADDTNKGIGDKIKYTINAPVPGGDVLRDNTSTIGKFEIVSKAGEGLKNDKGSVQVKLTGAESDEILIEGTHYTIEDVDGPFSVKFTDDFLKELAELRKGNSKLGVEVTFEAEVGPLPKNGVLTNEVSVTIPNSEKPIKVSTSTKYVDVEVTNPLGDVKPKDAEGSEFDIIACTKQAGGGYKVTEGAKPLHHTDKNGEIKLDKPITSEASLDNPNNFEALGYGLQFTPKQEYCAVQTKAPKGLIVNPTPTLLTAVTPAGVRPVYTTSVENTVKNNLFGRLPATGERTMLVLLALGLVLFAGGAAYQLRRKNA